MTSLEPLSFSKQILSMSLLIVYNNSAVYNFGNAHCEVHFILEFPGESLSNPFLVTILEYIGHLIWNIRPYHCIWISVVQCHFLRCHLNPQVTKESSITQNVEQLKWLNFLLLTTSLEIYDGRADFLARCLVTVTAV